MTILVNVTSRRKIDSGKLTPAEEMEHKKIIRHEHEAEINVQCREVLVGHGRPSLSACRWPGNCEYDSEEVPCEDAVARGGRYAF